MLEAEGIRKAYRKKIVLKDAGLRAKPGECIGIVGANGCGKTTLLSILAGAQKADGGRILIDGEEALGKGRLLSKKVAYVPQENPLIPELTVKDNMLLWYRSRGWEFQRELEEGPAAFLGIGQMLHMTAGKLSGGMKKRLSIACALSNHAPYLVLDEPGASLDLECKELIRRYLKQYRGEGGAVILTSHEMEELAACTRMYVLKEGCLSPLPVGLEAEEMIRQFHL